MTRTRTEAAFLNAAMTAPIFPRVARPVDVMDEAQFPELAKAHAHYAAMTPERRAELEQRP